MYGRNGPIAATIALVALALAGCGEPNRSSAASAPGRLAAAEPDGGAASPAAELATAPAPAVETAAAAPAATPRPAPVAAPATDNGLTIRRAVVARGVEAREPVGAAERFARNGDPIYTFLEVGSEAPEAQRLLVTFESDDGRSVGRVTLEIPANARRWRTWARSSHVTRPGPWTARIRTEDGELLGEVPFEVI